MAEIKCMTCLHKEDCRKAAVGEGEWELPADFQFRGVKAEVIRYWSCGRTRAAIHYIPDESVKEAV